MIVDNWTPIDIRKGKAYDLPKYSKRLFLSDKSVEEKLLENNTNIDLDNIKSIYVDSSVSIPRIKIRSIVPAKFKQKYTDADYVVLGDLEIRYSSLFVFKYDNTFITIIESIVYYFLKSINKFTRNKQDIFKILVSNNIIPSSSIIVDKKYTAFINETQINYINKLDKKNILYEKYFNNKLLSKMKKMTDEDLNTINTLLSSSDISSVDLGLDMLINYDILDRAISIYAMLVKNKTKIAKSKKINSVSFTDILNTLQINSSYISSSIYTFMHTINELYKISTNEEDKKMGKKIFIDYMKENLDEYIKMTFGKNVMDIKIDVNIS